MTERTNQIKMALAQVAETIGDAMNSIKYEMTAKLATIVEMKRQLTADTIELNEIASAVSAFAEDMAEFAEDMFAMGDQAENIVWQLDCIPAEIEIPQEDEMDHPADELEEEGEE